MKTKSKVPQTFKSFAIFGIAILMASVTAYAGGPTMGKSPTPKGGVIKSISVKVFDLQGYQSFEMQVNGTGVCDDLALRMTYVPLNASDKQYLSGWHWDCKNKKTGHTSYDLDHPEKIRGDSSIHRKYHVTARPGPNAVSCKGFAEKDFELNKPKMTLNPNIMKKKLKMQKK